MAQRDITLFARSVPRDQDSAMIFIPAASILFVAVSLVYGERDLSVCVTTSAESLGKNHRILPVGTVRLPIHGSVQVRGHTWRLSAPPTANVPCRPDRKRWCGMFHGQ
jgi:hypothetical protein